MTATEGLMQGDMPSLFITRIKNLRIFISNLIKVKDG